MLSLSFLYTKLLRPSIRRIKLKIFITFLSIVDGLLNLRHYLLFSKIKFWIFVFSFIWFTNYNCIYLWLTMYVYWSFNKAITLLNYFCGKNGELYYFIKIETHYTIVTWVTLVSFERTLSKYSGVNGVYLEGHHYYTFHWE